jgi:hypothetical protein
MSSLVTGDGASHGSPELDALCDASRRIRAGERTEPSEVEQALEVGFAAMIGMEAELSRLRPRAAPCDAPGAGRAGDLKRHITELSEALTELRMLSVRPGESRVGFGFVLPTPHRRQQRI